MSTGGESSRRRSLAGLSAVALMAGAGLAHAQSQASQPTSPGAGPAGGEPPAGAVEEVVITAQKRSERLQDVPVSVAVVTGAKLEQQHITSLQDLALVSPSISYNDSNSSRGQGLSIRGVGTLSFSDGVEPSVSTVLDGVVLGRQTSNVFNLIDIDHIEVLRGPQGTLFGKNSSAGVINIVTQRPSDTFSGAYAASYGELGEAKVQGTVTGPLVAGKLDARLTAYYTSNDGYIHDITTGADLNSQKQYGVRGKLLFMPDATTDILAIADYSKTTGSCCAPTLRSVLPTGSNLFGKPYASYVGVTASPDNENTASGVNSVNNQTTAGFSLQVDKRVAGFTLTSISAFRQYEEFDNLDADLIALNILDLNNANQHQNQFSQELRVASPTGQRIEFVAGLFYFYQGLKTTTQVAGSFGAVPLPATIGSQIDRNIHTMNAAVFGQATFHVTDKLSLIGGLRYTDERQRAYLIRKQLPGTLASGPAGVTGPPLAATNLASDEDRPSEHAGVQYAFNPNLTAYFTYSHGFKGAALNLLNPLTASLVATGRYLVPPEIPTEYEVGVRSSFLNRRVQLNVTGFSETFEGFQATAFDAVSNSNTLVSAGELRSRGVEVEALATPVRGLNLSANLAYTDATFTDFPDGPCYPGELLVAGSRCHALGATFVQDLKGARLNNAPKWSYNLGASYEHPLGGKGLSGFVDANYAYRSDVTFALSQDPNTVQEGYGVLSLNVGVQTPGRRLRLAVFARNLTDEHYASAIFASSFQGGNASTRAGYSQFFTEAAHRIVGVSLSGKF